MKSNGEINGNIEYKLANNTWDEVDRRVASVGNNHLVILEP
jgi:hypothetical protein